MKELKGMRPRIVPLIVTFLFLGGLLANNAAGQSRETEQPNVLEAIGTGVVYNDNVAKARDEAITHGLWNAVEEGVDSLISPESVLSHFQLLNDRVYSQPEQFIHDYKVLTESKSGRYYRVVVRTTLLMDMLRDKLQDIGVIVSGNALPSVVFLLSEHNVGEASSRYSWQDNPENQTRSMLAIEDRLAESLKDKGFVVIDPGPAFSDDTPLGEESVSQELTDEMAIKLAQHTGADVVVVGKGTARFSGNVLGSGLRSVEATVSVRALKIADGAVIGSFEASGAAVHANEMVAGTQALTIAASKVAQDLKRHIAASWAQQARQTVLVELVVQGIEEYVDFVRFRRILKNDISGVKNVYLRAIKAGQAKMDVDLQGDTATLADALLLQDFGGFGVNIFEVANNVIKLELIPKPDAREEMSKKPARESW